MTLEDMRTEIRAKAWAEADNNPNITLAACARLASMARTEHEARSILEADIATELEWLGECDGDPEYFWNR